MRVTHSGGAITLASGFFPGDYSGTVSGSDFTTRMGVPLEVDGARPCQDGTVFQQNPGVSHVSGRFFRGWTDIDGNRGEHLCPDVWRIVTYVWEWEATRQ